jgi:peptidyl-tRNA hydrolase, PTH1 family
MRLPFFRRQPEIPPQALVAGLGNPGRQYQNTRHNVGFRVIDLLAQRHRIDVSSTEKRAFVGYGRVEETSVLLAKPITFMNLSGECIAPLAKMANLKPEDVVVLSDEMDLPLGRLRIRRGGSAGGHNGLKSLIQHLGSDAFVRIRIGVGRPGSDAGSIDHVLGKFQRDELELVDDVLQRAADAVECILREGLEPAMNRYNIRAAPQPKAEE